MHTPDACPDPACSPCLNHARRERVVHLELLILDAEMTGPNGSWIDSTMAVEALDIRNVLDLVRGI